MALVTDYRRILRSYFIVIGLNTHGVESRRRFSTSIVFCSKVVFRKHVIDRNSCDWLYSLLFSFELFVNSR